MKNLRKIEKKRLFAGASALIVLAALLFSAFFIAIEADHDCKGEDCPVCALILLCENAMRNMSGAAAFTAFAVVFFTALLTTFLYVFTVCTETLFSRKVRLNN